MLPVTLDLADWPILATGRGHALHKRLALLQTAGAQHITAWLPDPEDQAQTSVPTIPRLPTETDIAPARLLLAAGLTEAEELEIGAAARKHRVLLNIEDRLPWCDFHVPALVRRGALSLAISTNGKSPATAAALRAWLERRFGPEWAGYLEEAATLRTRLRAEGKGPAEVIAAVRALPFIEELK